MSPDSVVESSIAAASLSQQAKTGLAGDPTAADAAVDVSALLEGQKFGSFLAILILASWVVTFFDGFDMNVLSFANLYMGKDLGMTTAMLGKLFSLGLLGTMLGGFGSGYLGDRLGRRPTIIVLTLSFGLLMLGSGLAATYRQLLVLRFLDGLAIGGILPVCWSLNLEYSPKRYRTTTVTLTMIGYAMGAGLCGPASLWLIPRFPRLGWRVVFLAGGSLSVLAALFLLGVLPESVRFLVSKGWRPEKIRELVKRIDRNVVVSDATRFFVADERKAATPQQSFRIPLLFRGELAQLTPLVWTTYFGSAVTLYFFINWGPKVFQLLGVSVAQLAAVAPFGSLGGLLFGFVLTRFIDRNGVGTMAFLPLLAAPLLLVLGLTHVTQASILLLIYFVCMVALAITQYGAVAITGIFYPSWYRANGTGWAASIGKSGAVVGPLVGGYLLSTHLQLRHVFCFFAAGPLIVAACSWGIGRIQRRLARTAAAT
jgi:AAHS family 4-hydroxybenzoate transporter-like MFS transporter